VPLSVPLSLSSDDSLQCSCIHAYDCGYIRPYSDIRSRKYGIVSSIDVLVESIIASLLLLPTLIPTLIPSVLLWASVAECGCHYRSLLSEPDGPAPTTGTTA